MDIKQLSHLIAVCDAGSFTRAAKRLGLAQPALSQSIKKLEQELEVTLVNRTQGMSDRGVKLTAEGEALLGHARLIVNQLHQAKAQIRAMASLSEGEVRIAVPGMLGSFYLPSRLMAFRHCYPGIKLCLFEGGTRDALRMLEQEEVDIAIITAGDLRPEFDSCLLLTEEMVVALGSDHPLAQHSSISLEDFLTHELVMFKPGYFHREWLLSQARALAISPNIAFETNLINLIKQLVSQGFAITSVLDMVITDKDGIEKRSFNPRMFLDLHIAWKKKRPVGKADRSFVEFLLDNK